MKNKDKMKEDGVMEEMRKKRKRRLCLKRTIKQKKIKLLMKVGTMHKKRVSQVEDGMMLETMELMTEEQEVGEMMTKIRMKILKKNPKATGIKVEIVPGEIKTSEEVDLEVMMIIKDLRVFQKIMILIIENKEEGEEGGEGEAEVEEGEEVDSIMIVEVMEVVIREEIMKMKNEKEALH
jgi:hypothetical protein